MLSMCMHNYALCVMLCVSLTLVNARTSKTLCTHMYSVCVLYMYICMCIHVLLYKQLSYMCVAIHVHVHIIRM